MNSGISDAFVLASKVLDGLSPSALQEYSRERIFAVRANISEAEKLYEKSLEIARTLGLDIKNLRLLEGLLGSLNRPAVSHAVFGPAKKLASLFLEVDSIGNRLGQTLRDKGLHIPLVLPEHEFQERVEGKELAVQASAAGWRQLWANRLAPNASVKLWSMDRGQASSTEISFRLIPTMVGKRPMPNRVVFGSSGQRAAISALMAQLGIDRHAFIELVDEGEERGQETTECQWTAKGRLLKALGGGLERERELLVVMRLDGVVEGLFERCIK